MDTWDTYSPVIQYVQHFLFNSFVTCITFGQVSIVRLQTVLTVFHNSLVDSEDYADIGSDME